MNDRLADDLRAFALGELGLSLFGITSAEPIAGGDALRRWVAEGRHGEMDYMAETVEIRTDPRRFLAGAQSVVCVAMTIREADDVPPPHARRPRLIARYARRKDYHDVIRPRLARLGRLLAERRPGTRWRPAVDTAPVAERELAQRAGLGWIGKNTCLINRTLGSHLMLGALVTDAWLPRDAGETDHCGTCDECLRACPTHAFTAPGSLDATACIAYLTIEHRSSFASRQSVAIADHLFGCDICQDVCPWNSHATGTAVPLLRTRDRLADPDLDELRRMDGSGWTAYAAGSPLRRLEYDRLRRNLDAVTDNLARGSCDDDPDRDR